MAKSYQPFATVTMHHRLHTSTFYGQLHVQHTNHAELPLAIGFSDRHSSSPQLGSHSVSTAKIKECPLEKEPFQEDMSSSNHQFSGDMLVFRRIIRFGGVNFFKSKFANPGAGIAPHQSVKS